MCVTPKRKTCRQLTFGHRFSLLAANLPPYSLPLKGKVPSAARRIGHWRYENEMRTSARRLTHARIVQKTFDIKGMLTVTLRSAPPGHSILRLWRGPSPRACSAVIYYRFAPTRNNKKQQETTRNNKKQQETTKAHPAHESQMGFCCFLNIYPRTVPYFSVRSP